MDLDCETTTDFSFHSGKSSNENDPNMQEDTYITGIYMNQTSNTDEKNSEEPEITRFPGATSTGHADADATLLSLDTPLHVTSQKPVRNFGCKFKKQKKDQQVVSADIGAEKDHLVRGNHKVEEDVQKTSRTRSFPCDYCTEVFKRMFQREEHIKDMHSEYYGKFVCLQCQKEFESRQNLYQHKLRTHEPVGEFTCDVCDSKFSKQSGLKRHMQIHSDNPKWVCSYCSRSSFLSKGDMERHIRNKHTGEKPYACKYDGCDRRFTSSGDRAKHHLHHTGEKRYQCTTCGLKMHTSGELKQHTWIHTGEKPYICTVCGEGFRQPFRLKMHTRIHTGEKPFQCETCGKSFSDKVYLKRHEAIHREERAHVCPQCGKAFKHDSNMRRHVATAHDKKFPYTCQECGAGCQGRDEFKRHMAKHNGTREFNCLVCNKGFYTQEDVNSHIKVVHNVVKSSCSKCGSLFKDLRSHKVHLLKIHSLSEESAEKEIVEAKKLKKDRETQTMLQIVDETLEGQLAAPKVWYTCSMCHKDFSYFKTLPKHYIKVHNLPSDEAHRIANTEKHLKDESIQVSVNDSVQQNLEINIVEGVNASAPLQYTSECAPILNSTTITQPINIAQLSTLGSIANSFSVSNTTAGVVMSIVNSNGSTLINTCNQSILPVAHNSNE